MSKDFRQRRERTPCTDRIGGSSASSAKLMTRVRSKDSDGFWQALAHMAQPDLNASSSSASARPYSLVSQPPIVEIDRSAFGRKVRDFMAMKSNTSPEYSDFVSSKAARTAMVARLGGGIQDEIDEARHCSYQLCRTSVRRFLWRASLRSGGRGRRGAQGM